MTAAVEAPEAQQDKQEPKPEVSSSTPLRREDAILFQGKAAFLLCLPTFVTARPIPGSPTPPAPYRLDVQLQT